jgi:hypothetical protein
VRIHSQIALNHKKWKLFIKWSNFAPNFDLSVWFGFSDANQTMITRSRRVEPMEQTTPEMMSNDEHSEKHFLFSAQFSKQEIHPTAILPFPKPPNVCVTKQTLAHKAMGGSDLCLRGLFQSLVLVSEMPASPPMG